jgi:hypothetical protein
MPSNEQIDRAVEEAPIDTRAYLRSQLMKRLGGLITEMDWDRIGFKKSSRSRWGTVWVGLSDPARWGKDEADPVLAMCETPEDFSGAIGEPQWQEKFYSGSGVSSRRGGSYANYDL